MIDTLDRDGLVRRAQEIGGLLMGYAPETLDESLVNLGSVILADGELKGGTLLVIGAIPGSATVSFDGTDGYIETGWFSYGT